jgi:hypothetical protein
MTSLLIRSEFWQNKHIDQQASNPVASFSLAARDDHAMPAPTGPIAELGQDLIDELHSLFGVHAGLRPGQSLWRESAYHAY